MTHNPTATLALAALNLFPQSLASTTASALRGAQAALSATALTALSAARRARAQQLLARSSVMDVVAGSIVLVSAIAVIDYLRLRRCVSTLTGRMVEARQAADADAEVAAATAEQHRQLRLEMDKMRGPSADCAVGAMCAGETCYQHHGITCEGGHYCCSDCLEQHVRREIAADLTSADQLKRDHRPNGEIRCPDHGRGCRAHLSLHEVAKLVPRKVFDEAFALRRRRIESAAFSKSNSQYEESLQAAEAKLNEKFQQQVDKINADLERRGEQRIAAVQIRVERDRSMLAEAIRRDNPDAKHSDSRAFERQG
eukprot:g1725.t1